MSKRKPKLILIGGGGHCKSCIDAIEQENRFEIAGIIDLPVKVGETVLGYPIIACDTDIPKFINSENYFLITLGQIKSPTLRKKTFNLLKNCNANIATILSPLAYVSKHAEIGEGTIIMHQAIVNANAKIGSNCIINTKSLIEHDAVIGNHCHISTGSIINGGCIVGDGTFYGSGAVSKEYIKIPKNSFIKANSIYKGKENV